MIAFFLRGKQRYVHRLSYYYWGCTYVFTFLPLLWDLLKAPNGVQKTFSQIPTYPYRGSADTTRITERGTDRTEKEILQQISQWYVYSAIYSISAIFIFGHYTYNIHTYIFQYNVVLVPWQDLIYFFINFRWSLCPYAHRELQLPPFQGPLDLVMPREKVVTVS